MSTASSVKSAGTRTGAIRRLMSVADPSDATSKTLPKRTRSRPLTCEMCRCAEGMPTEVTSRENGFAVKETLCPAGSDGCCERLGAELGPVKFDVSLYDAGSPPGGLMRLADPVCGFVPG